MMHVRIPDFSQPAARRVAVAADPIHAAIARHRVAWDVFQVAPEGAASESAETELDEALAGLLATACDTRSGAIMLVRHLRWWLTEEQDFVDSYQPSYDIALARAADLALLLGWVIEPRVPTAVEEGPVRVGTVAARIVQRLAADAPFSSRVAGELTAAVAVIAGGMWLTGLASLI